MALALRLFAALSAEAKVGPLGHRSEFAGCSWKLGPLDGRWSTSCSMDHEAGCREADRQASEAGRLASSSTASRDGADIVAAYASPPAQGAGAQSPPPLRLPPTRTAADQEPLEEEVEGGGSSCARRPSARVAICGRFEARGGSGSGGGEGPSERRWPLPVAFARAEGAIGGRHTSKIRPLLWRLAKQAKKVGGMPWSPLAAPKSRTRAGGATRQLSQLRSRNSEETSARKTDHGE